MKRVDRILVSIELGFAIPLALVHLFLCSAVVGPIWTFGVAESANRQLGSLRGLSDVAAFGRAEGYWFQDGLLTVATAAVLYPLLARSSDSLRGVVGLAMPLAASAVVVGLVPPDCGARRGLLLACIAGAWGFGILTTWGLPRSSSVVDRRILVSGIGLVFVGVASLLVRFGFPNFAAAAWGATVLGAVVWGRWVADRGRLQSRA